MSIFLSSSANIRQLSEAWLFLKLWNEFGSYKHGITSTEEFVKQIARKKAFINPFRDDTKPSLQMYYWRGRLRFHDYGDDAFKGDLFDVGQLAMKVQGKGAYGKVCDTLKLYIASATTEQILTKQEELRIYEEFRRESLDWHITTMPLRKVDVLYFNSFGIREETLLSNGVKGIDTVSRNGKLLYDSKLVEINHDPIVLYEYSETKWQIYRPLSVKNIKWVNWVGDLLLNNCDLNNKIRMTLITKSTKDCLLLKQIAEDLGIRDVSITNVITEAQQLSDELLKLLIVFNKRITLLYDNDKIGVKRSGEIKEMFDKQFPLKADSFKVCFVPEEKDISDYCKEHGYEKAKAFVKDLLKRT